jgi:uncharacterized RDD family membrane protein YckC
LARAAVGRWPEAGPFPERTHGERFLGLLAQWAIASSLAALFFALVPLLVMPSGHRPPILVAILFPAVVFGVAALMKYLGAEALRR